LAGASLASAATATGTTFGLLNIMAATNLKFGLVALLIAGAALTLVHEHHAWVSAQDENDSLRRQIADLKADNESLSTRLTRAMRTRSTASLVPAQVPASIAPTNNLRARLVANPLQINGSQLDGYLKTHHRDASSLLAAYRVSHDPALLAEAIQKYPNDPHVDFEALFQTNATAEERRQWVSAFEKSAPENALANYLSAVDYFKAGQTDLALQEMTAASGKQGFQDFTMDRLMDDREAYLDAGLSSAEAEVSAATQLMLPQLQQIKSLATGLITAAKSYQDAGDTDSAAAVLQMVDALGARYATAMPAEAEVSQLVGMAVERMALGSMDPTSPYGDNGQTVQDAINQLTQDRAMYDQLNQAAEPILENLSDQDYLTYKDRWMAFGEESALRWLIATHGQQ
jgi:hypothetical protein